MPPFQHETGLQRAYAESILHGGTVILPARPRHARDEAEAGVLMVQPTLDDLNYRKSSP